jgi:hypothetical protein
MRTRRLAILLSAAVAWALAALLLSPGCSTNACNDLNELCSLCLDPTYKKACLARVAAGDSSVCAADLPNYKSAYCPAGVGGGGGSSSSTGTGGGMCANGQSQCMGNCVNLNANSKFCGACNTQCQGTDLCAAGVCIPGASCPPALPDKNDTGGCTDKKTDPTCCGANCTKCTDGLACVASECRTPMSCTGKLCSNSCTDVSTDPLNCGACGNVCKSGQVCSAGVCTGSCGMGLTQCCGKCVDLTTDPANCGGCNPSCPEAQAMATSGGGCVGFKDCAGMGQLCSSCGCLTAAQCMVNGKTACNGACVDLQTDGKNCGMCGNLCPTGFKCSSGMCVSGACAPGKTDCGGSCADVQKDPNNCGGCGKVCDTGSGQACDNGYCKTGCAQPKVSCGGSCVDLSNDVLNCGDCNKPCAKGQVCSGGMCLTNCPSGTTNCSGSCVDIKSDFNNCGACGTTCNDNNVCTFDSCIQGSPGGKCMNESGAMLCTAGSVCSQSKCDPLQGCIYTPLSPQAIVTGCMLKGAAPASCGQWDANDLMNGQTCCLWCDASKPQDPCQYTKRADLFSCTTDTCEPARKGAPLHSPDPTWCANPANGVPECGNHKGCNPNDPKADVDPNKMVLRTGCVQDDANGGGCGRQCAPTCVLDPAQNPSPTVEGCKLATPAVCGVGKEGCAPTCSPKNANADTKGCVKNNANCVSTSCANVCNPDAASTTSAGCVRNNAVCNKSCAQANCDPESGSAKSFEGCLLTMPLQCMGGTPTCCPTKTNTANGCDTAAKCAM